MGQRQTYILSIREPEGDLVLEDVRTRRRALLADLSKIGDQISSWREQKPDTRPAQGADSPRWSAEQRSD
jgi:hypothetical protein